MRPTAELCGGADFGPPADMLVLTLSAWAEAAHLEALDRRRRAWVNEIWFSQKLCGSLVTKTPITSSVFSNNTVEKITNESPNEYDSEF